MSNECARAPIHACLACFYLPAHAAWDTHMSHCRSYSGVPEGEATQAMGRPSVLGKTAFLFIKGQIPFTV